MASGTLHTLSVIAKPGASTVIRLRYAGGASSDATQNSATFNLVTGQVISKGSGIVAASIAPAGAGYWQVSITGTQGSSSTGYLDIGRGSSTPGSLGETTYAGDGATVEFFVLHNQIEVGAFPTSPIPTTTAQVTRAADVPSVNVLSPWFNASEGTLFVEASTFGNRPAWVYAQVWDGTTSNRIGIARVQGSGVSAVVNTGGASQVATVSSDSAQIRAALAYRANDVSISRNGAVPEVDASVALPANLTQLAIGRSSGPETFLNGHIRSAKYFPRRLSDSELQALTA